MKKFFCVTYLFNLNVASYTPRKERLSTSSARFTWHDKRPSWTDGKGNEQKNKSGVEDCKDYHNSLPGTNPNHVSVEMQGLLLSPNWSEKLLICFQSYPKNS